MKPRRGLVGNGKSRVVIEIITRKQRAGGRLAGKNKTNCLAEILKLSEQLPAKIRAQVGFWSPRVVWLKAHLKRNRKNSKSQLTPTGAGSRGVAGARSAEAPPPGRKWLFRLVALVVIPLVLLGGIEAGLRLAGYG